MKHILIPTHPRDEHAIDVMHALYKKGHRCDLLYTADYPSKLNCSIRYEGKVISWQAQGDDCDFIDDPYDVVWYRRPWKPVLSEDLHEDDREIASREVMAFYQGMWFVISPTARWVNPYLAAKNASSKILQLQLASRIGFSIPPTLISNDPSAIKQFIMSRPKGEVIYKSFTPNFWTEEQYLFSTYTSVVQVDDLPSASVLQSVPAIFQTKIAKAFELRVTYFNNFHIAVKINSQQYVQGQLDWRKIPVHELQVTEFVLPPKIDAYCQRLMKALGLVFGCFDFIVTPQGEYYFLEINEQGQFLWIESINPEILLLDIFTNFLLNQGDGFAWQANAESVRLNDFSKVTREYSAKMAAKHNNPDVHAIK
eukprot:c17909_g1_i5.p1 GENE.c17909_g1_i5~~c17909_g1_i5.p1  ORF type:complete len:367 (-),score=-22.87 c17909_g1_i5:720-1820(-)